LIEIPARDRYQPPPVVMVLSGFAAKQYH